MNIWVAASDGRIDLVEKFLNNDNGLIANSKDPNGYTPIHAAAAYGHVDLLRLLCQKYNGDINILDNDGDTPLHHCEDVETAKVIIEELGGGYNLKNNEGKTALEVFEEDSEFPDLIMYLREKSGIPQDQDSLGINQEQLAMFQDSIRYSLENEPVDENDPEALARRQRVEQIMQGDNVDEELEKYVREVIRIQMMGGQNFGTSEQGDRSNEEPSTKRRK
ncbi:hypothetical protein TBLA_0F04020 [Henningerozyma blattae CBS 6284]|uniref:Uncharacterized protein n=1 Tax=Henningerozyma blattae (strain ATCC 34711 / CBS 6284 / DSM 70876 / NBRC 10599 / NRRL Y-10934 / UCD 77-7) TaxID=1071380 RepID=I2H6D3_HENB6|nr:hypothetical protein TBLA_0F04020 [Tetrapisispora blattae CBS 6284]CCH61935.1 hypothetical protein TBLA_0F04020 [Tetrapisispora blattae CBS 6284]